MLPFQGDPGLIRGDIVFTVSVPQGTDISVVSCEPGATVHINYSNSGCGNGFGSGSDNGFGYGLDYGFGNSFGSGFLRWGVSSHFSNHSGSNDIPVSVSVDINSKTKFNTMLVVTVDGVQVAQEEGTTKHNLDSDFTIS